MGILRVIQHWSDEVEYVAWEKGENYGDVWLEAMVDLPNNVTDDENNDYVIFIDAYIGNSAYG